MAILAKHVAVRGPVAPFGVLMAIILAKHVAISTPCDFWPWPLTDLHSRWSLRLSATECAFRKLLGIFLGMFVVVFFK